MIAQVSPPAFASIGMFYTIASILQEINTPAVLGWKFYLVFAICGFTNALFFWAFLPETRGIPLEGACVSPGICDMILNIVLNRARRLLQPRPAVRAWFAYCTQGSE